jgi:hypothetical protein
MPKTQQKMPKTQQKQNHVRSAAPLLGLRQLSTTERYYQQAQSLEAQRQFAKQVTRMRDE